MATFMLQRTGNVIKETREGAETAVAAARTLAPPVEGTAKSGHAQMRYVAAAYVLVIVAVILGWAIDVWRHHPPAPVVVQGVSVFAALYVAAQTIERIIEPITEWTGGLLGGVRAPQRADGKLSKQRQTVRSKAELKYRRAVAIQAARSQARPKADDRFDEGELSAESQEAADIAAMAQAAIEQDRRNSTVLVWGIASFLGIVLSASLGLALLRSVGVESAPRVLDIAVTGLAVGGGTKPLHDLISNLQATKDRKKEPAEVKPG